MNDKVDLSNTTVLNELYFLADLLEEDVELEEYDVLGGEKCRHGFLHTLNLDEDAKIAVHTWYEVEKPEDPRHPQYSVKMWLDNPILYIGELRYEESSTYDNIGRALEEVAMDGVQLLAFKQMRNELKNYQLSLSS
jgi:hypothetical protein